MDVLVSDTSVVIDLERAELIETVLALPYRFVVPDALYEQVRCHGVLWVFDQLEEQRVVTAAALHAGLTRVVAHPRCWLPREAVDQRLARYATTSR